MIPCMVFPSINSLRGHSTPAESIPLQGQSSAEKEIRIKNLKGLENQQALPFAALFLIFENRSRHLFCYEAGLINRPMCLWKSILFRIWYGKSMISVGINIGTLNQLSYCYKDTCQ